MSITVQVLIAVSAGTREAVNHDLDFPGLDTLDTPGTGHRAPASWELAPRGCGDGWHKIDGVVLYIVSCRIVTVSVSCRVVSFRVVSTRAVLCTRAPEAEDPAGWLAGWLRLLAPFTLNVATQCRPGSPGSLARGRRGLSEPNIVVGSPEAGAHRGTLYGDTLTKDDAAPYEWPTERTGYHAGTFPALPGWLVITTV